MEEAQQVAFGSWRNAAFVFQYETDMVLRCLTVLVNDLRKHNFLSLSRGNTRLEGSTGESVPFEEGTIEGLNLAILCQRFPFTRN